jgi:solute carrier family 25 carnitine/acylcarnitine transporter 20/29
LKHAHNAHGNAHNHKQTFRGPFDALHKIVNGHGIRGLYRGFAVTAWREVPAFGLYFAAYDCIKESVSDLLCSRWNWDTAPDSNVHLWAASSLGGGFSGALTWALIYPFDVVKTRIQTAPLETPIEKRRMVYMFRKVLDEHGWRFFFRGLGVTLLRAFPVNAIIFPVYEITLEHLSDNSIGS